MEPHIQSQLLDLNRSFYEHFARQFADSRNTSQASITHALSYVGEGGRILDVGCGDGRAARALDRLGRRMDYLGIDASPSLIALARERASALTHVTAAFAILDITQPDWPDRIEHNAFNHVLALALLHHIPGDDLRVRLVQQIAALLRPSGTLIVSTWQFLASERLRRKIVPWATIGLDESQVEAGDYLLDWRRGGYGLRYCHLISEADLKTLCQAAGLAVREVFFADNGLNLYAVAGR
ncbi:MAG: class I SAM-dependent methyltransferase [Anaerolineae bacterium]|nr:class I SAM-dependent methyltransferase [Anaerolineae bacterium]